MIGAFDGPTRSALWAVSLCMLAACGDDGGVRRIATPERGTTVVVPPRPPTVDGLQSIDAAGLRKRITGHGRGTLVSVWASWCGSCQDEIPMLLKLRDAFAAEGVDFLFLTADEPAAWPKAVELMRQWGGPLPTLAMAGPITALREALNPNWRGAIPATFLFDATFKLRHYWEGPVYDHEVSPVVQGFLAGDAIDGETGAGP